MLAASKRCAAASETIRTCRFRPHRVTTGLVGWLIAVVALGASRPSLAADKVACVNAHARAQELRQARRLRDSRQQLLICSQDSCPVLVRADCREWLPQVESRLVTIKLVARDRVGRPVQAVRVFVDGELMLESLAEPLVRVDPGPHVVRFESRGGAPMEKNVVVAEDDPVRLVEVTLAGEEAPAAGSSVRAVGPRGPDLRAPEPRPEAAAAPAPPPRRTHGSRTAPLITAGAAVIALGTGAFFGYRGLKGVQDLRDECGSSCDPKRVDPLRTDLRVADVALGTAVILGAVTGWLLWRADADTTSSSGLDPGPGVGASASADGKSWRLHVQARF